MRDVQLSLLPELVPARPQGWILPSVFAGSNAELIAAVSSLYLVGEVLDATYGDGHWWDRFRPPGLVFHDRHKVDGVDFRSLPHGDGVFDAVCFDPPYVLSGTDSSARLGPGFQARYGIGSRNMDKATPQRVDPAQRERVPALRQFEELIVAGLLECCRVSRGWVLVKCMEFAQGSNPARPARTFHDVPHLVTSAALEAGLLKHDQIVHHTGSGPGGHNVFEPIRARRHHSYLMVFSW